MTFRQKLPLQLSRKVVLQQREASSIARVVLDDDDQIHVRSRTGEARLKATKAFERYFWQFWVLVADLTTELLQCFAKGFFLVPLSLGHLDMDNLSQSHLLQILRLSLAIVVAERRRLDTACVWVEQVSWVSITPGVVLDWTTALEGVRVQLNLLVSLLPRRSTTSTGIG